MSADQYRREAKNYLSRSYEADLEYAANLAAMANASALLAIEARLGELVEVLRPAVVQQIVNTIGDAMTGGPFIEGDAR